MKSNLSDDLRINMGGRRAEDIFVIISADGSTVARDPGLARPFHTLNKKYAEEVAKGIGGGCKVTDLATAIKSVVSHQKNLPKHLKDSGFRIPDLPT